MLTSEKLHLLLTREDGRSLSPSHHDVALAAAVLADLRDAGIVSLEDAPVSRARVLVTGAGATDHPVLDALLPEVDGLRGKKVAAVVGKGRPKARKPVVAHLVETDELVEHKALLNTRHTPVGPGRPALVAGLTAGLDGDSPSDEDRLLLGVLHQLNVLRRVLPEAGAEGESRREQSRRLERLTHDDLLVQAVGRTVSTVAAVAAAAG